MNHRLGAFLVFLLRWIFFSFGCKQVSFVAGFCIHPPVVLVFPRAYPTATVVFPTKSGVLGLSADNNNSENEEVGNTKEQQTEKKTTEKNNAVLSFLDKASEYLVLLAGAGVAITLAINLLGYGWVADRGGGVRFDSIQNLRTERQLERSLRPIDETTTAVNNPNPVTTFFRKSPFVSALVIAIGWQALEESRDNSRKDR